MNLNTHVHAVFPDGVFARDSSDGGVRFVQHRAPTSAELTLLCERIHLRFVRWLGRHGLLQPPDEYELHADGVEAAEPGGIDACVRAAIARGELAAIRASTTSDEARPSEVDEIERALSRPRKGKHVGEAHKWSITLAWVLLPETREAVSCCSATARAPHSVSSDFRALPMVVSPTKSAIPGAPRTRTA